MSAITCWIAPSAGVSRERNARTVAWNARHGMLAWKAWNARTECWHGMLGRWRRARPTAGDGTQRHSTRGGGKVAVVDGEFLWLQRIFVGPHTWSPRLQEFANRFIRTRWRIPTHNTGIPDPIFCPCFLRIREWMRPKPPIQRDQITIERGDF